MSRDKNGLCIPHRVAMPVTPEIAKQTSVAQIAAGGTLDFDFNVDSHPILDLYIRTDVALTATLFVRATPTDTFAQLGAAFGPVAAFSPLGAHVINALRVPASQARIRITNPTVAITTVCVVHVSARSM